MPNVIVQLRQEVARVRALLPFLSGDQRDAALTIIRFAEASLAMNDYPSMRDAIGALEDFTLPPAVS